MVKYLGKISPSQIQGEIFRYDKPFRDKKIDMTIEHFPNNFSNVNLQTVSSFNTSFRQTFKMFNHNKMYLERTMISENAQTIQS